MAMVFRGAVTGVIKDTALMHDVPFFGGRLGRSLALGGDMDGDGYGDLVAGAPGDYPANTANVIGHVVVYFGGPGAISTNSRSTVIGTGFSQTDDGFGFSVASVGDIDGDGYLELLVGAPGRIVGHDVCGRATLFYGWSTGPVEIAVWQMDGEPGEALGYSVSTVGDGDGDGFPEWAVGAPDNAEMGRSGGRVVLAYYDFWNNVYPTSVFYGQETARLGASLGPAGDVNGDGYAELIVGGPSFDVYGNTSETGHAELHSGGSTTIATTPVWTETLGGSYGTSVAGAGDVNGDGFADILASASDWTNGVGYPNAGFATLHLGSPGGPSYTPDWTLEGGASFGEEVGKCVASAGDVNRDGYDDILVGAPSSGAINQGRVFAFYGSAAGLTTTAPNWQRDGQDPGDFLGEWVAGAGDVNGDGYADVLVCSPGADSGPIVNAGRVDLFLGSYLGLTAAPYRTWFGIKQGQEFGYSAAGAGDVNGDGYDDIVVGSPYYDHVVITHAGLDTLQSAGRADVYFGGPYGPGLSPDWTRFGTELALFGASVAGVGDLNGDGVSDFAVGETNYNGGDGRVQVYVGSAGGPPSLTPMFVPSPMGGSQYGTTVAAAGDVDGDGYGDLAVTAPLGPGGMFFHEGFAFVYRGAPGGLAAEAAGPDRRGRDHRAAAAGGRGRRKHERRQLRRRPGGGLLRGHRKALPRQRKVRAEPALPPGERGGGQRRGARRPADEPVQDRVRGAYAMGSAEGAPRVGDRDPGDSVRRPRDREGQDVRPVGAHARLWQRRRVAQRIDHGERDRRPAGALARAHRRQVALLPALALVLSRHGSPGRL